MENCFSSAIDVGTGSLKLVVYNEGFKPIGVWSTRAPLEVHRDTAVQDPDKLVAIFSSMVEKADRLGCKIIGVSVYRGSVLAWGSDGTPATKIVTWLDRRTINVYKRLGVVAKLYSMVPGLGATIKPGSPALAMKMIYEDTRRSLGEKRLMIWTLDSYLAFLVSSKFIADISQATLTGILNPYSLKPIKPTITLLNLRDLRIPGLQEHSSPVGEYKGVRIGPFIADQQAASIGLGCVEPGCMKITLGTGVFIDNAVAGKPGLLLGGGLLPVILLSIDSDRYYGVEGFASGVGLVYEAFAEALGGFKKLEELAAKPNVKPVLVIPAIAGLRTPYKPMLYGGILGVSPGFNSTSLAKGLVIGTALLVRHIASLVSKAVAQSPKTVRVGGGLSRIRVLVAHIAAALGRSIEASIDYNDSARGAAILAAYANGLLSRKELVRFRPETRKIEPLGENNYYGLEEEKAWRRIIDVIGSKSFSNLLNKILK